MSKEVSVQTSTGKVRRIFEIWLTFLRKPLNLRSRLLLVFSAVALVAAIFFPVWKIRLVAPQYTKGLDISIYAYKLDAGNGGQDLVEVNILNHYIGMKALHEADFFEMRWMPFAFGLFFILMLRAAVLGLMTPVVDLVVLMSYFGLFSIGSFAYRLYTYGHQLDPKAPVTIQPFMPILIGSQKIANFTQSSYPMLGAYLLGVACILVVGAALCSMREEAI